METTISNHPARRLDLIRLLLVSIAYSCALASARAESSPETIRLFNGHDFKGWYVYTEQTKRENPGVFQVVDGMIYVPGGKEDVAYLGGLITEQPYENYRLRLEYKWGEKTYGVRKNKARDAGVLLHCTGPHGPGPWMNSYEFQIIEGGTGDLLLVNVAPDDTGKPLELKCTAEIETRGGRKYFKPGSELATVDSGRLNWWGRDSEWQDNAGFQGREDVESPFGQWTKCEIVARADTLEYFVNDQLVNRVRGLSVQQGKILLQTEGAEVWYRNLELTRLGKSTK